ncbi:beta-glucosidase [Lutibacter oricola]|uniref:Beta-glucosidase n=1 Tax=Lutibacter oricola TaxID=762486 RepID=A0A1H2VPD2_9FLAO|nr:glycoside hydrolase family 3 protein [Lutibacter oricola]SDW70148.1 beta-glucosidase [Lutibacter oricola]
MKLTNVLLKIKKELLIVIVLLVSISCGKSKTYQFKFQNPTLSTEERVSDLVSQMTLKEKVSQMRYDAPAIERLGLPEYNWWNECLHGVARAGEATVFPQAIGMGATFNEDLMFNVGTAISDEARAKYHHFSNNNKRGIYQGLTFWTPNINIFRDPRWGRGQETYGEDPYLTSRMGVNFIKALQGDDPNYLKVVATAKHFAVHSGPEKSRHEDNYLTSDKDLRETYLPAFESAIKEAKVHSIMCAYNRYNDEACCGSNLLLQNILRNEWNFEGYVVSDCWAINDFWEPGKHELVKTPSEAAALAVDRGTDLNCGSVFDPNLTEAVLKEMIDEEKIDIALSRLMTARFKLGMFDEDENVEYSKIPYSVVASKKHYALSEKAARESMILLKNENDLLPLNKNITSLALIGPNTNFEQVLLGNYHGTPNNYYTPLKAIQEKLPNATIYYEQGCEIAEGWPLLSPIPSNSLKNGGLKGLKGEYFTNKEFKGEAELIRNDTDVDFSWLNKKPLDNSVSDEFSVRWTGELIPKENGNYRVAFKARSGVKMYVNDSLRFEFSNDHEAKTGYFEEQLIAGESYKLKIEYSNYHTDPQAHLLWAKLDKDLLKPAIEVAKKAEAVILFLGLTPEIEGEEMSVVLEGFDKGDRSDIKLPASQVKLMKEIQALGKPTILVLMNGSAIAVNWADKNIPAILEAWYPGEFGGKAIADVLFGDYNPSGRLPVTFYKSVNDLPDFKSYAMKNRTYRYFKNAPLYPFGHGLSYTNFTYSNVIVPESVTIHKNIPVSVEVTNSGDLDGDEVVQLYVTLDKKYKNTPIRSLIGFKRVHLKKGETKTVSFLVEPKQYAAINEYGEQDITSGSIKLSVGGKQPNVEGFTGAKSTQVITKVLTIN